MNRTALIEALKGLQRDAFDAIQEAQTGSDPDEAWVTYLGRSEPRMSLILEGFLGSSQRIYPEKARNLQEASSLRQNGGI
ncbi:MAG: hypothetical protein VX801_03510 [Gemmatimonadota bacterium]|nr:hypothetical protein [Gemmatimonadota bacterium]